MNDNPYAEALAGTIWAEPSAAATDEHLERVVAEALADFWNDKEEATDDDAA